MLDLLLPRRCLACGRPGEQVCRTCLDAARRLGPPLCDRCGAPTAWPVVRCRECTGRRLAFARARAALAYDPPVRRIVGAWKERGLRRLAVTAAAIIVEAVALPRAEALCPLPPDRGRTLRRGHHPAGALATELSRLWGIPLTPLLSRSGAALPQRGLSLPERRRNVAGAFAARGIPPACVLLVDDVYTTGSTVDAAARALRRAGARRIEVVTFARTVRLR